MLKPQWRDNVRMRALIAIGGAYDDAIRLWHEERIVLTTARERIAAARACRDVVPTSAMHMAMLRETLPVTVAGERCTPTQR